MAYITGNPKSKKQVKEWLEAGKKLTVYQPGPFGRGIESSGHFVIEGPHYPEPHKFYGKAVVENGVIVKFS